MPTYTVRTTTGRLNGDARATLARAMTTAHTAATGAQGFFAQVVFEEVDADRHFVGGAPIADELVFVHGQIRAGRTPEQKAALLDALGGAVREALGVPRRAVWVYLVDLPGYGEIVFDIAYGGAFYALADCRQFGLEFGRDSAARRDPGADSMEYVRSVLVPELDVVECQ